MYLQLGADMAVREESLIGIFDLDNLSVSKHSLAFLKRCQEEGAVIAVTDDLPRSAVLTMEFGMERLHLTGLSSRALVGRLEEK